MRAYVCPACKKDFTTRYHQRRRFSKQHCSSSEIDYIYHNTMLENSRDILHSGRCNPKGGNHGDTKELPKSPPNMKTELDLLSTGSTQELSEFEEKNRNQRK